MGLAPAPHISFHDLGWIRPSPKIHTGWHRAVSRFVGVHSPARTIDGLSQFAMHPCKQRGIHRYLPRHCPRSSVYRQRRHWLIGRDEGERYRPDRPIACAASNRSGLSKMAPERQPPAPRTIADFRDQRKGDCAPAIYRLHPRRLQSDIAPFSMAFWQSGC